MAVYVDDVRHKFGRMVMCHMWADSVPELVAFAVKIGLRTKWLQSPPKASWHHFDVSLGMKQKALEAGAILTDKYGPAEHQARQRGDKAKLELIARVRAREAARKATEGKIR